MPIRVLLISNGFAIESPLGGIERFVIALAEALDRTRVEPIVCGLWDFGTEWDAKWMQHLRARGIHAFTAAPRDEQNPLRNYREIIAGIRTQTPCPIDIIHSHSEWSDPATLLLRRTLGARAAIRTVHNEREWKKSLPRRLVLTQTAAPLGFAREFGVSRRVVENLNARPLAKILGKRAEVLHNVVDFSRFPPNPDRAAARAALTAELGIPVDAPLLGTVGRLVPQKGFDLLLAAVPAILRQSPNAHLLIAGDGPDRAALEAQAASLGIADRVHLLGPRSDVERLLPALDLFVSSSRWEGLSTVIMEAMASGTAVLGTQVSGSSELIEDGVSGVLVPPEDIPALSAAAVSLLGDAARRARLANAANAFVREHFSVARVARQHEAIYEEIMRGR